ncbi:uncharacterized protein C2845_PM07G25480 [Panicum miliaceum]|uniref:XMAP215/Dis1/CLASP TOG domain-containing protein n=1 Tax=Panicum miliaceum TaxID=4540 RepID=A0A3L6SRI7_PANMI|nr:uncharacterized protein C2845_PM07G25480 [Panicum miliaceum]
MDLAYPRYAKEVCDAIVAKCLTGRPKTLEKAQAAFLLWVELEAAEVFLESMEQAVKNKVAKAVVPAIDVMFQALSEFGTKVVPPKKILKMLPELFDHPDQNVWASSKGLTLELCRWIGKEPVKSILFEKMRDTMKKELEAELANVSGIAKPTRKIRSEQEKQLEEEAVAETTGANTSEEAVADEVRDASFSVLTAIVKIVGMKPLERSLEKLDDVRKKKLSDMIGSVSDTALSSGTETSFFQRLAQLQELPHLLAGAADSLSMKRSAASMLSGKKPVQAEAATKKSGRSKSTAAKKTDGGSQSKTSAAPEIEDIEGSSAGALSDDMVYLPKLTMGAIPRPYLSQGALTTAQLLNDFRNLQQIGKAFQESDPVKMEGMFLLAQFESIFYDKSSNNMSGKV